MLDQNLRRVLAKRPFWSRISGRYGRNAHSGAEAAEGIYETPILEHNLRRILAKRLCAAMFGPVRHLFVHIFGNAHSGAKSVEGIGETPVLEHNLLLAKRPFWNIMGMGETPVLDQSLRRVWSNIMHIA